MFLVAQKKRPDALNSTQNKPALYKVRFLKKSPICNQNDNFWRFFFNFSETVHCKKLRFFALHSVHQDAFFELSKNLSDYFSDFRFQKMRGCRSLGGDYGVCSIPLRRCSRGCSTNTFVLYWFNNLVTHPFPPNLQSIITPQPLELRTWNFDTIFTTSCVSCDTYHVTFPVMCPVTYHVSHVT